MYTLDFSKLADRKNKYNKDANFIFTTYFTRLILILFSYSDKFHILKNKTMRTYEFILLTSYSPLFSINLPNQTYNIVGYILFYILIAHHH